MRWSWICILWVYLLCIVFFFIMMKFLIDLCMFCIVNNFENIKWVGLLLCKNDKEFFLELFCDYDMFIVKRILFVIK